jgi:hypothetical protein
VVAPLATTDKLPEEPTLSESVEAGWVVICMLKTVKFNVMTLSQPAAFVSVAVYVPDVVSDCPLNE